MDAVTLMQPQPHLFSSLFHCSGQNKLRKIKRSVWRGPSDGGVSRYGDRHWWPCGQKIRSGVSGGDSTVEMFFSFSLFVLSFNSLTSSVICLIKPHVSPALLRHCNCHSNKITLICIFFKSFPFFFMFFPDFIRIEHPDFSKNLFFTGSKRCGGRSASTLLFTGMRSYFFSRGKTLTPAMRHLPSALR